jgi:mannose-6-phosphate isomerase-like protein (cupin superfamily)
MPDAARVLESDKNCPTLALVEGAGRAHAVAWPGVGSTLRSMTRFWLGPSARTVSQEHEMEAVYYVIAGEGVVNDADAGTSQPLAAGAMAHVEPRTTYQFRAGASGMELIGGPCPPDPALYRRLAATAAEV